MKLRIMFCLVLVALFGFVGNSFAIEEIEETTEIKTPVVNKETIGITGTEGTSNTFYGINAGHSNTSGNHNTFIGYSAGYNNEQGSYHTFVGRSAGYYSKLPSPQTTELEANTFIGCMAGYSNLTGKGNTYVGADAGRNSHGSFNAFFGLAAGRLNSGGGWNTFLGAHAGYDNTSGSFNSYFGMHAGRHNNGSGNVFLGYRAGYYQTATNNQLFIDNSSTNNPLIWGDFSQDNVVINGGFRAIATSSSSDERWKRNIQPLKSSLEKIALLQGVSYEWKIEEYPDVGMPEGKQIGLVAQEVEKVLPELVPEDKDGYKGVSYSKLTAVLVEAVKELKAENERQRMENKRQQKEIEELRAWVRELNS